MNIKSRQEEFGGNFQESCDNIKSLKRPVLDPLPRRHIFGNTTGGIQLTPQSFKGERNESIILLSQMNIVFTKNLSIVDPKNVFK